MIATAENLRRAPSWVVALCETPCSKLVPRGRLKPVSEGCHHRCASHGAAIRAYADQATSRDLLYRDAAENNLGARSSLQIACSMIDTWWVTDSLR
jgi:hypothetical protein